MHVPKVHPDPDVQAQLEADKAYFEEQRALRQAAYAKDLQERSIAANDKRQLTVEEREADQQVKNRKRNAVPWMAGVYHEI